MTEKITSPWLVEEIVTGNDGEETSEIVFQSNSKGDCEAEAERLFEVWEDGGGDFTFPETEYRVIHASLYDWLINGPRPKPTPSTPEPDLPPVYVLNLTSADVDWVAIMLDHYGDESINHKRRGKGLSDLRARVSELTAQVKADE